MKFHLDEDGTPTGVYFKVQKEANWLIEEFMLLANKNVAAYASRGGKYEKEVNPAEIKGKKVEGKTFVYRIHDMPDPEKLESFSTFITKFGHTLNPQQSARRLSSSLNQLLDQVQGKKEQNVVEMMALRSMAKARYSTITSVIMAWHSRIIRTSPRPSDGIPT